MDKQMLIERLLALPKEIEAAEMRVLEILRSIDEAGKQAETMIKHSTTHNFYTGWVAEADIRRDVARANYARLMNEFRALQTVARLLGGEGS